MIASSCVFIALQYTRIGNVFKHFMCILGKRREEKRVQIVCKKGGCANFVQIKLDPESVQTLCKDFWPAVARGWPVARPDHRQRVMWQRPGTQTRLRSKTTAGVSNGLSEWKSFRAGNATFPWCKICKICLHFRWAKCVMQSVLDSFTIAVNVKAV
jgi:hypothetical protein